LLDKLRERMVTFLSAHRVGVLSTSGRYGAWAMPVHYRNHELEVECLLPRWADVTFCLDQDPHVLLVVLATFSPASAGGKSKEGALRWLLCTGTAQRLASPDWEGWLPAVEISQPVTEHAPHDTLYATRNTQYASHIIRDLYLVVHITPKRIDLMDENQGWGARETLDL
jgi:hypothetical protein